MDDFKRIMICFFHSLFDDVLMLYTTIGCAMAIVNNENLVAILRFMMQYCLLRRAHGSNFIFHANLWMIFSVFFSFFFVDWGPSSVDWGESFNTLYIVYISFLQWDKKNFPCKCVQIPNLIVVVCVKLNLHFREIEFSLSRSKFCDLKFELQTGIARTVP